VISINIGVLATGRLTATLLVAAYLAGEYSYDGIHVNCGRIVQLEFSHNDICCFEDSFC